MLITCRTSLVTPTFLWCWVTRRKMGSRGIVQASVYSLWEMEMTHFCFRVQTICIRMCALLLCKLWSQQNKTKRRSLVYSLQLIACRGYIDPQYINLCLIIFLCAHQRSFMGTALMSRNYNLAVRTKKMFYRLATEHFER